MIDRVKTYRLTRDYYALDTKMSEHLGREIDRYFPKDSVVEAELYDSTYVIHKNRFLIPVDYLTDVQNQSSDKSKTTTNIKDATSLSDLTVSTNRVMSSKEKANGYVKGGIVGLAIGVVAALYLRKKPLWWGVAGFVVGGYTLNKFKK